MTAAIDRQHYLKLRTVVHDRNADLPVFTMLVDRLRTLLEARRQVGVLVVTVDNLGLVESLYGWQLFDRVQAGVARELREAIGDELPCNALLAINGVAGDQFIAFVPDGAERTEVDAAFLEAAGQAVCTRLERVLTEGSLAGMGPRLAFRCGHAVLTQSPFYRFERRVYAAIEHALSREERLARRRDDSWDQELRRLLSDDGLRTLFQPVIDMHTYEVLGYEALSRGPEGTLFEQPRTMFAVSTRMGVEGDLDRRCRSAALRASCSMGERRKIFLNALPVRAGNGELGNRELLEELERAELQPSDVVFEFSDRSAGEDAERFVSDVARLRSQGFGVALDDVGTGYASQSVLEQSRPDYLKLDVSLVRDVHANPIKQELLHSLVRIAERIESAVIAEGVETEAEAHTLREAGARYGQGFLFAAPVPPESIESFVRPGGDA